MNVRRSIVAVVACLAALLLCGNVGAQAPKIFHVGLLSPGGGDVGLLGPEIVQDFARRGYVPDRTIVFEKKAAQGKLDRLPALVAELVASHVDVIITVSYPAAIAAKEHAGSIPIVVTQSGDPVATQLVASLARPGGTITGVSEIAAELSAKRLQLLKEAVPGVRSVAVLWNADDLGMTLRYRAAEAEAPKLGMVIVPLGVHAPDDFDTAFSEMTKTPPDAILMVTDILTNLNRKRVIDFAAEHHMPSMFEYDSLAHDGGLMAYGPNVSDIVDRAAGLADRILHGAKPAELPLELPTRFQFAINLKTAKALGITVSESAQLRADDVIE
jgi:putative tryptophan/tyrosine transport system substrate-binding protein